MPAQTIEGVIHALDEIITSAEQDQSRLGYFAALYKAVTKNVKIEVDKGPGKSVFQDVKRMERLDVIFANRYLDALQQYQAGNMPSRSWEVAFKGTTYFSPIVLQHLFVGMNAHIMLDLGIAAAEVVREFDQPLDDLHHDFNEINIILAALVHKVETELSSIWPPLRFILKKTPFDLDQTIVNFGMEEARDSAWRFAQELSPLDGAAFAKRIQEQDQRVARQGHFLIAPSWWLQGLFFLVRITEVGSISNQIQWLNGKKAMQLVGVGVGGQ